MTLHLFFLSTDDPFELVKGIDHTLSFQTLGFKMSTVFLVLEKFLSAQKYRERQITLFPRYELIRSILWKKCSNLFFGAYSSAIKNSAHMLISSLTDFYEVTNKGMNSRIGDGFNCSQTKSRFLINLQLFKIFFNRYIYLSDIKYVYHQEIIWISQPKCKELISIFQWSHAHSK